MSGRKRARSNTQSNKLPSPQPPTIRSTPVSFKISSTRCTEDHKEESLTVDDLAVLMSRELALEGSVITDAEYLVESIFSDEHLPIAPTEDLLYDISDAFHSVTHPLSERDLSDWLNRVGEALASHFEELSLDRGWDARNFATALKGSPHKRKPDVMLLDKSPESEPTWIAVRALCETTSVANFHQDIRRTISQKSFLIFNNQFNRRFVPSLAFFGPSFRFIAIDRAGVVYSPDYNIQNDKLLLLRIIIGLMFANKEVIGYDLTMRCGSDGEICGITVDGKEYIVVEKLFSADTLKGRATQCWRVQRDGKNYVIKDSWVRNGRPYNEIEMLRELADVEHVPTLVAGEDIRLSDGSIDSTNFRRNGVGQEERLHRRLVMEQVAEPLHSFTSKKELIGAIADVIRSKCHDCYLFK